MSFELSLIIRDQSYICISTSFLFSVSQLLPPIAHDTYLNDLLEDWTASTKDKLVSFELSLIIRDQSYICISSLLVEIFEHQLQKHYHYHSNTTKYI